MEVSLADILIVVSFSEKYAFQPYVKPGEYDFIKQKALTLSPKRSVPLAEDKRSKCQMSSPTPTQYSSWPAPVGVSWTFAIVSLGQC